MLQDPDEVCSLTDIRRLAETEPTTPEELAEVFGTLTAQQVADEILSIVAAHRTANV